MNRKIKFSEDEYYHIYNRGVDKRSIFIDKYDYERFLLLLDISNSDLAIDIRQINRNKACEGPSFAQSENNKITSVGAYCLMPNHFHILIREKTNGGITKFLKKLLTSYSMYFNKKYDRSGALFQGVFRARHVDKDEYLKYLYSYIHLNPVKLIQPDWKERGILNFSEACNYLDQYKYSSYSYYINPINKNNILSKDNFPEYFSNNNFKTNLLDWLKYK